MASFVACPGPFTDYSRPTGVWTTARAEAFAKQLGSLQEMDDDKFRECAERIKWPIAGANMSTWIEALDRMRKEENLTPVSVQVDVLYRTYKLSVSTSLVLAASGPDWVVLGINGHLKPPKLPREIEEEMLKILGMSRLAMS